jgi:hypothetical protein
MSGPWGGTRTIGLVDNTFIKGDEILLGWIVISMKTDWKQVFVFEK